MRLRVRQMDSRGLVLGQFERCRLRSAVLSRGICCLAGERQVPHRAFSPVRNDKMQNDKMHNDKMHLVATEPLREFWLGVVRQDVGAEVQRAQPYRVGRKLNCL